jgi:hypothetical protein
VTPGKAWAQPLIEQVDGGLGMLPNGYVHPSLRDTSTDTSHRETSREIMDWRSAGRLAAHTYLSQPPEPKKLSSPREYKRRVSPVRKRKTSPKQQPLLKHKVPLEKQQKAPLEKPFYVADALDWLQDKIGRIPLDFALIDPDSWEDTPDDVTVAPSLRVPRRVWSLPRLVEGFRDGTLLVTLVERLETKVIDGVERNKHTQAAYQHNVKRALDTLRTSTTVRMRKRSLFCAQDISRGDEPTLCVLLEDIYMAYRRLSHRFGVMPSARRPLSSLQPPLKGEPRSPPPGFVKATPGLARASPIVHAKVAPVVAFGAATPLPPRRTAGVVKRGQSVTLRHGTTTKIDETAVASSTSSSVSTTAIPTSFAISADNTPSTTTSTANISHSEPNLQRTHHQPSSSSPPPPRPTKSRPPKMCIAPRSLVKVLATDLHPAATPAGFELPAKINPSQRHAVDEWLTSLSMRMLPSLSELGVKPTPYLPHREREGRLDWGEVVPLPPSHTEAHKKQPSLLLDPCRNGVLLCGVAHRVTGMVVPVQRAPRTLAEVRCNFRHAMECLAPLLTEHSRTLPAREATAIRGWPHLVEAILEGEPNVLPALLHHIKCGMRSPSLPLDHKQRRVTFDVPASPADVDFSSNSLDYASPAEDLCRVVQPHRQHDHQHQHQHHNDLTSTGISASTSAHNGTSTSSASASSRREMGAITLSPVDCAVLVRLFACPHTRAYTYRYTCAHTHKQTLKHTNTHTHTHTHTRARTFTHTLPHMRTHSRTCTRTHTYRHTHTHIHAHTHTDTHTRTHAHIHIFRAGSDLTVWCWNRRIRSRLCWTSSHTSERCIRTHANTRKRAHTHAHMRTNTTHIRTHAHTHTHTHTHTHIHTHIHIHTQTHTQACKHTQTHAHTHTSTHTLTCAYNQAHGNTRTDTHTHSYTHARIVSTLASRAGPTKIL